MNRRGPAALFLTGSLFVLTYALGTPGYDVPGLPFVTLAPFLALAVSARSARQAAWRGWIAGTAASVPLYYWIAYTVAVPGKLGWALGSLAAFLVSAYVGAYLSVAAAAAHRLESRFGERGLWLFPFVWIAVEMARSYLFTGFPWMLLGYTLAGSATLRQAADLAGVHGLSFLLALSGVSVYLAGRRLSDRFRPVAAIPLIPGIAVILFLVLYGRSGSANPAGSAAPVPEVKVAIAQGGIDQSVKWNPGNQSATLRIYGELTQKARDAGAQVVVWPETAAPFFYGWETELSRRLEAIAVRGGIPILFGAPWYDPAGGGKFYNSVFQMDARGVVLARYDKRHLVPFGEYIPLRPVLFFLSKLTEGEGNFSTGTSPALFRIGGQPVAASICYEALFPALIREGVLEGATWLVNVTNDAWFGDTVAPLQHLAMARMRCVEFRRPMVRAANSGISAVIDADGGADAFLGLFRRGVLVAGVRPATGETVYAKTGEIFGISCSILAILAFIFPLRGSHGIRIDGRENIGA
ncbi:apolipoprotein N-acyltransferase [Candidatus Deferrimicrobium sp.]|uniref:apolipoprotein N-acyltransferase n=1 Tax=Candidatus Deferrimicrobium sp. TaxID=3060586 RepID=UPI003C311C80